LLGLWLGISLRALIVAGFGSHGHGHCQCFRLSGYRRSGHGKILLWQKVGLFAYLWAFSWLLDLLWLFRASVVKMP